MPGPSAEPPPHLDSPPSNGKKKTCFLSFKSGKRAAGHSPAALASTRGSWCHKGLMEPCALGRVFGSVTAAHPTAARRHAHTSRHVRI